MKTKGEKSRNWQETEKERIQRRLEGGRERGIAKEEEVLFQRKLGGGRGESGQGQTEEIHSRINTRGCDSSFLLLLFPL